PPLAEAPDLPDNTTALIRQALTACGLSEAITGSLTNLQPGIFDDENESDTVVRVLNPLSEDHQVMRRSLIPGLVRAVACNQDHGRQDVCLFETGRIYHKIGGASDRASGVAEESIVAGALSGRRPFSSWESNVPEIDFYFLRGVVENLSTK